MLRAGSDEVRWYLYNSMKYSNLVLLNVSVQHSRPRLGADKSRRGLKFAQI